MSDALHEQRNGFLRELAAIDRDWDARRVQLGDEMRERKRAVQARCAAIGHTEDPNWRNPNILGNHRRYCVWCGAVTSREEDAP